MPRYYVTTDPKQNGDHEVHKSGCHFLPEDEAKRFFLGFFNKCDDALIEARTHYPKCNGCYYCSKECYEK